VIRVGRCHYTSLLNLSGGSMSSAREKNNADKRELYQSRRKSGICVGCGEKPATASEATGRKVLKLCEDCRRKSLDSQIRNRVELKKEVMSHYGKDGNMLCNWEGCNIEDPDMLTIDHIDNSGSAERKKDKSHAGTTFYAILKRTGYPEGFQTLCHNHQWKKEMVRRRA